MTTTHHDVIVVGGGSLGLAAAYHAARDGARVLVLERQRLFNDRGASGQAARQFRIQYNQREVSQLVLDSLPLWHALARESGRELLLRAGCLWFGDPTVTGAEGQIAAVTRVMQELRLAHEPVDAAALARRFAFRDLRRPTAGSSSPTEPRSTCPARSTPCTPAPPRPAAPSSASTPPSSASPRTPTA